MLPALLVACIALAGGVASSSVEGLVRFPDESHAADGEDYNPEAALAERAEHVIKTCLKYSEATVPEYSVVSLSNLLEKDPLPQSPLDTVLFETTEPRFQMCSPRHVFEEGAWQKYKDLVETEFPPKKKKKSDKNSDEQTPAEIRKKIEKRLKVLSVMHPLRRLAKSYLKAFRKGEDSVLEEIRTVFVQAGEASKNTQLTFKNFVHFLTRGAKYFSPDSNVIRDWRHGQNWAPFFENCPVCHHGLFPSFVLKIDSHFEEDFEYLQEVFGLEDVDFPSSSDNIDLVSDNTLKTLYSQLTSRELDELVDFYRIDLEMFRYSPEMFYSIVQS